MLRCTINSDSPAVLLTVLIQPSAKVPDKQICLHLQLRNLTLKVLLALLSESGIGPDLGRKKLSSLILLHKKIHDLLTADPRQLIVPPGIKIVPVTAKIGKVRKPLLRDESGLLVKELTVSHIPTRSNHLSPFPGINAFVSGPPVIRSRALLHRKSRNLIPEQRQKTDLPHVLLKLLSALYPVRIIPGKSLHDPSFLFYHEIIVTIHSRIAHLLRDCGLKNLSIQRIRPIAGGDLHGRIRYYSQSLDCE